MREDTKDHIAFFAAGLAVGAYLAFMVVGILFNNPLILLIMAWFSFSLALIYSGYFQKFLRKCPIISRIPFKFKEYSIILWSLVLGVALGLLINRTCSDSSKPILANVLTWLAILILIADKIEHSADK